MDIGTTVLISVTSLIVIGIGAYIAYVVGKSTTPAKTGWLADAAYRSMSWVSLKLLQL